jgi:hypothetical protein
VLLTKDLLPKANPASLLSRGMQLAAVALLVAAPATAGTAPVCTTDTGCSLNGICQSGSCVCDSGWGGPRCAVLQLAPAQLSNGYKQPGRSSWGGSVLQDEQGTFHMFVEELVNSCGLNTYARNMRIARATALTAEGPYKPASLVTSYSASTPHAVRDPSNGDWLVFGTGCGREACMAVTECANATTWSDADMNPCPDSSSANRAGRGDGRGQQMITAGAHASSGHAAPCTCPRPGFSVPGPECSVDWGTNVWRAPSPGGPWNLSEAPLMDVDHPKLQHADGTPLVFANPSALLGPNCSATAGTAALMYRDYLQKLRFPSTNVLGIAWSHTGWRGPYLPARDCSSPRCADPRLIVPDANEDPFIYRGPRGTYHMIAHSLCSSWPRCPAVGGHAASTDGKTWHYSGGAAYTTNVQFADGTNVTYSRRERPELLLDEHGLPTHLITGVVESSETPGTMNDRSWTLVQPVMRP